MVPFDKNADEYGDSIEHDAASSDKVESDADVRQDNFDVLVMVWLLVC
jgi:hypothetical protein